MTKTYAFTDIHGCYILWKQIELFLEETDSMAYFLGDACDRGEDGIKIMLELIDHPRVKWIMGNHDYELGENIKNNIYYKDILDYEDPMDAYYMNTMETRITLDDLYLNYSEEDRAKLYKYIKINLPKICIKMDDPDKVIILSHSGFPIEKFNDIINNNSNLDCMYNRDHIYDEEGWPQEYPNVYMVHGHTPVQYPTMNTHAEVYYYCDGHKIDIDMGCINSGKIALLDLETFEPLYFYN